MMPPNTPPSIEQQYCKTFALGIMQRRSCDVSSPILNCDFGIVADMHGLRSRALAQSDKLPLARLTSAAFRILCLEQVGLIHITLFPAVHPFARAASGWVTLAGGAAGHISSKR